MKLSLAGVFPALTTPSEKGRFSKDKFANNIKKYNSFDLSGYLVLGSTGESVLLSDDEKLRVVETAVNLAENKLVIAGTGAQTPDETINFTNKAAKFNIAAALVVSPFYYKQQMTAQALIAYFSEVANSTEVPILLYNVPKYTGVVIPVDAVESLSTHENIIGIKDSSGDLVYFEELSRYKSDSFFLLQGSGSVFYPSLVLGGNGGILALANMAPADLVKMYHAAIEGRHEYARSLQMKLLTVNQKIVGKFGVPGIKFAMDLLGYYGGEVRLPLQKVDKTVEKEIASILKEASLFLD